MSMSELMQRLTLLIRVECGTRWRRKEGLMSLSSACVHEMPKAKSVQKVLLRRNWLEEAHTQPTAHTERACAISIRVARKRRSGTKLLAAQQQHQQKWARARCCFLPQRSSIGRESQKSNKYWNLSTKLFVKEITHPSLPKIGHFRKDSAFETVSTPTNAARALHQSYDGALL